MPWPLSTMGARIRSWLRDYDRIQNLAVMLLYVQIGCSLLGSLGVMYNGVHLVNLVVALFALVAVESSSQALGRTYAVLLFCSMLLDIAWLILYAHAIWNISTEAYEPLLVFSLKLTLWTEIVGFSVRSLSSLLWIQIYRLGASLVENTSYQADYDLRNSFINPPAHQPISQSSTPNDVVGGSIYDPTYYSSLFEDSGTRQLLQEDESRISSDSSSRSEEPRLKACISKSFQVI